MNRKDAIEILKEIARNPLTINESHLKREEAIRVLEEPLTLADLLGWEEGVEYDFEDLYVLKVENDTLFKKSEECSSGWCNFALFTDRLEDLRQAKKVEKKLKAYHVKDEYDFEALKEELIKKGYKKDSAWRLTLDDLPFILDWVGKLEYVLEIDKNLVKFYTKYDFEEVADKYEIEEYKDERLFYAKIKGWELLRKKEEKGSDCGGRYFIYAPSFKEITTVRTYEGINYKWIVSMTKTEWNELGINDTNADFEEVK